MTALNLTRLLAPISDDAPTGADLEYDADFGALERAAAGKPEQVMGDKVIDAEPPDWAEVLDLAEALLGRTKDLRVAVHLTQAATKLEGLAGLDGGLALLRGFLESWWDGVYPRLDPEDGNDPTLRVNCLLRARSVLRPGSHGQTPSTPCASSCVT